MLYLIEDEHGMKIGYCKNDNCLSRRISAYLTHSSYFKLISTANGTRDDENNLHHKLAKYRKRERGEWFSNKIAVVETWLDYDDGLYFYPDSFDSEVLLERYMMRLELNTKTGFTNNKFDMIADIIFEVEENTINKEFTKEIDVVKKDLFSEFEKDKNFQRQLKLYCEYRDQHPEFGKALELSEFIPDNFHRYYSDFGTPKLNTMLFLEKNILSKYKIIRNKKITESLISDKFLESTRHTNKDIKKELQGIYDSLGLEKKAKATDMEDFYTVKRVAINIKGSYVEGLELISKK